MTEAFATKFGLDSSASYNFSYILLIIAGHYLGKL